MMLLLMVCCTQLSAQTSPASVMQRAILAVFEARMVSTGAVAANSPTFVNTITPVSANLTTAAVTSAGTTLPGVSATSWVAIASFFAGVGQTISLTADGLLNWFFNANGTVTIPGVVGSAYYANDNCPQGVGGATPDALAASCQAAIRASWAGVINAPTYSVTCEAPTTLYSGGFCTFVCSASLYCGGKDGEPMRLPGRLVTNGTAPRTMSLHDAVSSVNSLDAAKPVSPSTVASLVNSAWSAAAASPGYVGVPYTNPITVEEVVAVQAASSSWPTVGDLIQETSAPAGVTAANVAATYTLPGANLASSGPDSSTAPSVPVTVPVVPGGNATVNVSVDLGPSPGVLAPGLESTPTASMILSPIVGLLPTLKNFVVPSHSAVCPTPSFSFFGSQQTVDAHCTLLEPVRPTMSAVMAVIWIAIALFIVLSA